MMISEPETAPSAVGVKIIPMVQLALVANVPELGQVLDAGARANSPLPERVSELITSGVDWLLVRVIVWTVLGVLSAM
ncbi:MAG: hypothetical protein ABSE51_22485 [Terracidiphilus sp.]|jgi:hypothetical protein